MEVIIGKYYYNPKDKTIIAPYSYWGDLNHEKIWYNADIICLEDGTERHTTKFLPKNVVEITKYQFERFRQLKQEYINGLGKLGESIENRNACMSAEKMRAILYDYGYEIEETLDGGYRCARYDKDRNLVEVAWDDPTCNNRESKDAVTEIAYVEIIGN